MKPLRTAVLVVLGITVLSSHAQEDVPDLDLLKAPASPASNMLGIANEEVQRPTDLTGFMFNLRQASENFSALPVNYAVDVAPYWLTGRRWKDGSLAKRTFTVQDDATQGSTGWQRFLQSVVVSTAVADLALDTQNLANTKAGFGLRASLVTPKATQGSIDELRAFQLLLASTVEVDAQLVDSILRNDEEHMVYDSLMRQEGLAPEMKAMYRRLKIERRATMQEELEQERQAERAAELAARADTLEIERKGAFLDMSTGLALEFVDRDIDNGQFRKGGVWLSGGYTTAGLTFTAMARLLFDAPVEVFLDDGTTRSDEVRNFDVGGNIAFDKNGRPFTFSAEALWRQQNVGSTASDTWRLVANASYALKENRALTFSFGRNFDGTRTKGGNLVAGLNLLLGFGGAKK